MWDFGESSEMLRISKELHPAERFYRMETEFPVQRKTRAIRGMDSSCYQLGIKFQPAPAAPGSWTPSQVP